MRIFRFFFLVVCIIGCFNTVSAEIKEEKFTKGEIKKMAETKAVIETKFGNIELRFFPDAAPGHVIILSNSPKRAFMTAVHFTASSPAL